MNEREYIDVIEKLNQEIISLYNSREYNTGKKFLKCKSLLKRVKVIEILNLYISSRKKKKFENNFLTESMSAKNDTVKKDKSLNHNCKIAVYTAILGDYDILKDPYVKTINCDYFAFSDKKIDSKVWKYLNIPDYIKSYNSNTLINRYLKMHPYELFKGYDYAIYVDGKVTIISDLSDILYSTDCYFGVSMHNHSFRNDLYDEIQACIFYKKGDKEYLLKQKERYENEKMPKFFGMKECAVICTDLNNCNAQLFYKTWWSEFIKSKSMRDQICLPYVIWSLGKSINDLGTIEKSIEFNKKFRISGVHNG